MASQLASAHIEAERRLRVTVMAAVRNIWLGLSGYDERNVDEWLTRVLPVIATVQRASAALTDSYLARAMERQPIGIVRVGSDVRNGTSMEDVYKRPFITLWSKLDEQPFTQALTMAENRAASTAAMDTQLAMRGTADAIEKADPTMFGFHRAADPGACEFCRLVDGAYVKRADAMPLHNHCGCGLEPNTEPHALAAQLPSGVAVHEHGELGPVLAAPGDHFTSEDDLA